MPRGVSFSAAFAFCPTNHPYPYRSVVQELWHERCDFDLMGHGVPRRETTNMPDYLGRTLRLIAVAPLLMLAGCVYSEKVVEVQKPAPAVVAVAPPQPVVVAPSQPVVVAATPSSARVVYSEGRWQLYGDGKASPYYWVWIPTGMTPPAPPQYPSAAGAVVVTSPPQSDRVVYSDGRWQLYGDGRTTPYYWVWIPAGRQVAMHPAPPPLPQAR
jgi:hypothetical protein